MQQETESPRRGGRTNTTFRTSEETNGEVRALGRRVTVALDGASVRMDVLIAAAVAVAGRDMPLLLREIARIEGERGGASSRP